MDIRLQHIIKSIQTELNILNSKAFNFYWNC